MPATDISGKQGADSLDPAEAAAKLFRRLAGGREAERNYADRVLGRASAEVRAGVRDRILEFLEREHKPGGELLRRTREAASTYTWMLYALARLSADNGPAMQVVRRNLDPAVQPDPWVRYWALAGLARSGRHDLKAIAEECVSREKEPLVKMVAQVLLAREGGDQALAEIRLALNSDDTHTCWTALRALRVADVDDEQVVGRICQLVARGDNSDITYDALKAAYHVRRTSERARDAAHSLAGFVARWRTYPARDSMRAIALIGLGKLGVPTSADLLVEELSDDNPSIVREAARSLETILGTRVAVSRVLEAAHSADRERIRSYANALRYMEDRDTVAAELSMAMGSGSPEQQERSRLLLSELGGVEAFQKLRARSDLVSQYAGFLKSAEEKIRTLFEGSMVEAHHGFRVALRMDIAVFVLGFALILVSAALQLRAGQGFSAEWVGAGATGAAGALGVLYSLLVAKPRRQVTREVDHLMSLKVVFLGYLRQLHQSDQAYVRRIFEDRELSLEELEKFSRQVESGMQAALESLGKLPAAE